MKESFKKIKELALVWKYTRIPIYTLGIFSIIRNMEKGSSSGLISSRRQKKAVKEKFSIMMESGGEDFLMEMECIKKLTVPYFIIFLGDLYMGTFKNGLKHGMGT